MSADDFITLTPPGWAAVASEHLVKGFPELAPYQPQIQFILRPLFRKAVDAAMENAYRGLIPNPQEQQHHEDPSPRS